MFDFVVISQKVILLTCGRTHCRSLQICLHACPDNVVSAPAPLCASQGSTSAGSERKGFDGVTSSTAGRTNCATCRQTSEDAKTCNVKVSLGDGDSVNVRRSTNRTSSTLTHDDSIAAGSKRVSRIVRVDDAGQPFWVSGRSYLMQVAVAEAALLLRHDMPLFGSACGTLRGRDSAD